MSAAVTPAIYTDYTGGTAHAGRNTRPDPCATLCYMMRRTISSVGVRELRQNLSVYLDRVKKGEALTVTEHGAAVAILRPLPAASSPLERLVAEGRGRKPVRDLGRSRKFPTSHSGAGSAR